MPARRFFFVSAIASWAAAQTVANLAAAVVLAGISRHRDLRRELQPTPRAEASSNHGDWPLLRWHGGRACFLAPGCRLPDGLPRHRAEPACSARPRSPTRPSPRDERSSTGEVWTDGDPSGCSGVAVGATVLSYGAISARNTLAGGGPAALVAGTLSATLVAFLALLLSARRAAAIRGSSPTSGNQPNAAV